MATWFWSPQNKVSHCFHCFPIYLPWSDWTACHDLSFLKVEFQAYFFTLLFHFHQERKKKKNLIRGPAPTGTLFWTLNVNQNFKFVFKKPSLFPQPFLNCVKIPTPSVIKNNNTEYDHSKTKLIHFCLFLITWISISSVKLSRSVISDSLRPMNCSMPGLPVQHQLLEFTQTHVHRVHDAIQPIHPLLSPFPPAPNPSQHQGLFQWVNSSHEVAKVLEFQL